MKKTALITGITGQDGSYLAELLLDKGYEVHGLVRRCSTFNRQRIEHLYGDFHHEDKLHLHYGDLTDFVSVVNLVKKIKPDEIYNLGAQSHVAVSYEVPNYTAQASGIGVLNVLEAVKVLALDSKIYQASTSELFRGNVETSPQSEETLFDPVSPYGAAKLYAHQLCKIYREAYGMFISTGILFNHESPRRGKNFVTRKITVAVNNILRNKQKYLYLGNLEARRDWGYAPEYVEGMWRMLQQEKPGDYVLATGETHTIKEFCEEAFKLVDLNWEDYVKFDKRQMRPNEVDCLCGNTNKAREELGWMPKVKFKELVKIMIDADVNKIIKSKHDKVDS